MNNHFKIVVLSLFFLLTISGCGSSYTGGKEFIDKIKFNLDEFNHDGLYGPDGGLRSMDYEFCIPTRKEILEEIEAIDPSLKIYTNSPGRIGCSDVHYLCIGNTDQVGWRTKLLKLASKEYIEKIQQSFFE